MQMNQERLTLLLLRGSIAELDEDSRKNVEVNAEKLREFIASLGDHGLMAFALVGAEIASDEGADIARRIRGSK